MQIKAATKEELALLITGLRSMAVMDQIQLQKRLLKQLENELTTRYGVRVSNFDPHRQTKAQTESMVGAHAEGLHDEIPREGCPDCR